MCGGTTHPRMTTAPTLLLSAMARAATTAELSTLLMFRRISRSPGLVLLPGEDFDLPVQRREHGSGLDGAIGGDGLYVIYARCERGAS